MEQLQKQVQFLLDKYSINKKVVLESKTHAVIDGEGFDILPWRNERRFIELKKMNLDGTLSGMSTVRILRIENAKSDFSDIQFRVFDLCEWLTGSTITELYTVKNGKAANTVAKLASGVVCTIETAATLQDETQKPIDKHELICAVGVACDRVVDTQIPQNSVYLYTGENSVVYTDTDFELFGLSSEEVALVRHVFELAKGNVKAEEWNKNAAQVRALVSLAKTSAELGEPMKVADRRGEAQE